MIKFEIFWGYECSSYSGHSTLESDTVECENIEEAEKVAEDACWSGWLDCGWDLEGNIMTCFVHSGYVNGTTEESFEVDGNLSEDEQQKLFENWIYNEGVFHYAEEV